MFALISAATWAAIPVVTDGPLAPAIGEVSRRTGLLPESLRGERLSEVIAPGVVGAVGCDGPRLDRVALALRLDAVISAYDEGRLDEAGELARALTGAIACASEAIDPDWAWRAGFVRGVIAWARGDRLEALSAWTCARGIDPDRPWDNNFAPRDALPMFVDAAPRAYEPLHAVGGPFLVDGQPATDRIAPGLRVLQAGDPLRTWLVEVRGPVAAVHPSADPYTLATTAVTSILAGRLPNENLIFLVRGDEVIRVELPAGLLIGVPAPARRKVWREIVGGTGGLLFVAGTSEAALAAVAAHRAARDGVGVRGVAFDTSEQAWRDAWVRINVGGIAAGAGAGLVIVAVWPQRSP